MKQISSVQNATIKKLSRLKESRERRKMGLFLVETERTLERALSVCECVALFYLEDACPAGCFEQAGLSEQLNRIDQYEVSDHVLGKLTFREKPVGFAAVMRSPVPQEVSLPDSGLVLVMNAVEKPGNLGAILRSADAVGVNAVLIESEREVDLYHPQVIRNSSGVVFSMPIQIASREALIQDLRTAGYRILVATPEGALAHEAVDWHGSVALVVGAEAEGVSSDWKALAAQNVSIEMAGVADSLNVSVATAVMLFEARGSRKRGVGRHVK